MAGWPIRRLVLAVWQLPNRQHHNYYSATVFHAQREKPSTKKSK